MDFDSFDRVVNMLNYSTPQDVMSTLVGDGFTPERAHIIICAAKVYLNRSL